MFFYIIYIEEKAYPVEKKEFKNLQKRNFFSRLWRNIYIL